jgi:hypothetical protein
LDNKEEQATLPQEELREAPSGASAETRSQTQARDSHQLVQDIAIAIGEAPSSIRMRADAGQVLERMREGLIITLRIKRPRFWLGLNFKNFGLFENFGLVLGTEAEDVVKDYFRLGGRSLLPKAYRDEIAKIEASARQNITKHGFKTHWGTFVPLTQYRDWKTFNSMIESEWLQFHDNLISNYDDIVTQVIEESRPLAEEAWKQSTVGSAVQEGATRDLVELLQAGDGKETFITNYLAVIRAGMPSREDIASEASYEIERSIVPLPSLVAADMEHADRIYRERALRDAETQAELEKIELARRAEQQKLSEQQRLEQEARYQKLSEERERQRLQWEMERDVIRDAKRQKEKLLSEFYTGVIGQINEYIKEVSEEIVNGIEKQNGKLHGRSSVQLTNFIDRLAKMNFVQDRDITEQLKRIKASLPTENEKQQAAKGIAKIDTTRITNVLREVHAEAAAILVDLSTQSTPRKTREQPALNVAAAPISLGERRKKRVPVALTENEEQATEEAPVGRKRRSL